MVARNPGRSLDERAFEDHFDWWCGTEGPFISFFNTWDRALYWRYKLINGKAFEAVIIAVWLDGLELYDALEIAKTMPSVEYKSWHYGEYLLRGGIDAGSGRILARFNGILSPRLLALHLPDLALEARLPGEFPRLIKDATQCIMDEVQERTGDRGGVKFESLILSMGGRRYSCESSDKGEMTIVLETEPDSEDDLGIAQLSLT
ncbi:hypothetical protein M426DRAFT_10142 [Hypoxylon sp. CI-4A]|nr:hypothetical protein M426DRAFT_10142 [Hypoxylon sp. CI-4A]